MTARVRVPAEQRLAGSPAEIAGMVGLSVDAIRDAINSGALRAHRHGRRIVIPVDAVRVWLGSLPPVAKTQGDPELSALLS